MTVVEACSAEIMKLILSMTFTGSIISIFLFLSKGFIRDRLPKSFQYYMWFSAVIAFLLPVSKIIAIPISDDFTIPMKSMHDIAQRISEIASQKPVNLAFAPQIGNGQGIRQITGLPSIAVALSFLWQSGMILVLGFHIICYVSYVRRLGKHNISADHHEIELLNTLLEKENSLRLYKNSIVDTPILIGFFRPAIILPDKNYEDIKLRNILIHEVTHRKRYDIFAKWLLIFVEAVHWFNPLIYFVRREMSKACELACDETIIKGLDRNGMQQYGDTLIAVAADSIRKVPPSIAMLEDKKNLKERLGAIMKHKKHPRKTTVVASVILAAMVCAIFGVNAFRDMESKHNYMDKFSLKDQMNMKVIELQKDLCNYDKENIDSAYVHINYSDDGVTEAYLFIIGREMDPDSEMLSGIITLASEELKLDTSNIYLDYVDSESLNEHSLSSQRSWGEWSEQ